MKSVSGYTERPGTTLLNLGEAARRAGFSTQRFRRAIQLLKIPVRRSGWTILVPVSSVERVQTAINGGEIKRGRPATKKRRVS